MKNLSLVYKVAFLSVFFVVKAMALPTQAPSSARIEELRTSSVNWPDSAFLPADPISRKYGQSAIAGPPRKVFIDAGHGGKDEGAIGVAGIMEKTVSLNMARILKSEIERRAHVERTRVDVRVSRDTDHFLTLKERVALANNWGADAFVSIHGNSSSFIKAKGFEVYFLSAEGSDAAATKLARAENDGEKAMQSQVMSILSDSQTAVHVSESSRFAEVLYDSLARGVESNGRGVRQAPFAVLSGTTMPAVLIEIGYLTNAGEAKKLADGGYLKRLADAISTGVVSFLKSNPL